jgi:CRP-like cAMP-binding protein
MSQTPTIHHQIDNALQEVTVFGEILDFECREKLFLNGIVRVFAPEEIICEKDQQDNSLFLILKGVVEIIDSNNTSARKIFGKLKRGEIFGEVSALKGRPRIATVRAKKPCVILEIPGNVMKDLMITVPEIRSALLQRINSRTIKTSIMAVPLLSSSSAESLVPLFEDAELLELQQGETIVEEGQEGESFYIVSSGNARVHVKYQDSILNIATLNPGQFFGEWGIVFGHKRAASVTAICDMDIVKIHRDTFLYFLYNNPDIESKIKKTAKNRHSETTLLSSPESNEDIEKIISEINDIFMGED